MMVRDKGQNELYSLSPSSQSVLFFWPLETCSKREQKQGQFLDTWAWKWYIVISAAFYWLKEASKSVQIQEERKQILPLVGIGCKVISLGCAFKGQQIIGTIFAFYHNFFDSYTYCPCYINFIHWRVNMCQDQFSFSIVAMSSLLIFEK